jgi:hypothetical protein
LFRLRENAIEGSKGHVHRMVWLVVYSLQNFKREIRRLKNRKWGVSIGCRIFRLSLYIRVWINYWGKIPPATRFGLSLESCKPH